MIRNIHIKIYFILGLLLLQNGCSSVGRLVLKDINQISADSNNVDQSIITEEDIEHLPTIVQKYFKYANVIGKQRIKSSKITWDVHLKMDENSSWLKCTAEQYNTTNVPSRIYHIKSRKYLFLTIKGKDSYINGKGNMLIKLMSLFTVADEKGAYMNQSALVTYLGECVFFPTALLALNIKWEALDSISAKATIEDQGISVSGIFSFNEAGQIINFVTDDRFMEADKKVRWSTPFRDYKEINGFMIPRDGEAIWHLNSGDFYYAKVKLVELKYDNF